MRLLAAALPVAIVLVAASAFGGRADAIGPGDRVGAMLLVRGTQATADLKLFDVCDPVITKVGRYRRTCGRVPHVRRLFIGYGPFAPPHQIDKVWSAATWEAWLDGRRIRLAAFGASDRTLYRFPAAGFKDVTLREWRVMLVGATPGRHTLRYRVREPAGTSDASWTFTVTSS